MSQKNTIRRGSGGQAISRHPSRRWLFWLTGTGFRCIMWALPDLRCKTDRLNKARYITAQIRQISFLGSVTLNLFSLQAQVGRPKEFGLLNNTPPF